MKIEQIRFLDVLSKPNTRFVIPVFQRVYSWTARQCEDLWDDVMRAGESGEEHFMGMLLYSHETDSWHSAEQLSVIDGQQRMTTLTLLLTALRGYLMQPLGAQKGQELGLDEQALQAGYLTLEDAGDVSGKLVLSQMDRATLFALAGAADMPEEPAQRLVDNCLLFSRKMDGLKFDLACLWRGLQMLTVASVLLEPQDSPQLVFESLNSKGMPLSTADRMRNLLIASTAGEEQEHLYTQLWLPLEHKTAQAQPPATVSDVVHAWLAQRHRSVRIFDEGEVYGLFKNDLRDLYDGSFERLLQDLGAYCDTFLADEEFRKEAQERAEDWIAGKPEELISEFKMFGD